MNEIYLILFVFLSACLYYILKNRMAIFFPSFPGIIRIIQDFADAGKDDLVYDLGSGDGRVLEPFARKGIRCVGVEHNPFLNKRAKKRLNHSNAKILQEDIFNQNLSDADVIIAYLSKSVTKDLQKKIRKECKKGTRIILVSYKFRNWELAKEDKYLWIPVRLYVV